MTLGEKIQHLRKQHKLSQKQLASQMDVSRQAISKWELNEAVPDTEHIKLLSSVFGVSTDYLLYDDFESDMDIPIVQVNSMELKKKIKSKAILIAGWVMAGIGGVSVLTMWILSTIIPSMDFVLDPRYASSNMYTLREVRKLGSFLSAYHLEVLFGLCCVILLAGVILLAVTKIRKRK